MCVAKYQVEISYEKNKKTLYGKIITPNIIINDNKEKCFDIELINNSIFNPLTALCDLLEFKKDSPIIFSDVSDDIKFILQNRYCINYDTNGFNEIFGLSERYTGESSYNHIMYELKSVIVDNKSTSLIKLNNDLEYQMSLEGSLKLPVPLTGYIIENGCGYETLFKVYKDFNTKTHAFYYNCNSEEEIIYSILHYLTLFNYKFIKCKHCERYTATKNNNDEYCKRLSPYNSIDKRYKIKECKLTVVAMKKSLSKRREKIYKKLDNYFENSEFFKRKYHRYMNVINKSPTIKNLDRFCKLMSKENENVIWFKEKYRFKKN